MLKVSDIQTVQSTTVEHIGVHGFNVLMATGGFVADYLKSPGNSVHELCRDPVESGIVNEPKKVRQERCTGGKSAQKKVHLAAGDWMLTSKTVRQLVSKNINRASKVSPGKPKLFEEIAGVQDRRQTR